MATVRMDEASRLRSQNAPSDVAERKARHRSLVLGVLGVAFEYYDFVVYAAFAPYFSRLFFPQGSALGASLQTLAIFAIGFLARPVGAMLAGRLADRYGRKPVMVAALVLATGGSLLIAVAPTYRAIGAFAPFVLVAARLMQGLAHGMESISAFVYTGEMANARWRTLQSCAYPIGLALGIIMGTLLGALLSTLLSHSVMQDWGWRLPFAAGVVFGLTTVALRRGMHESAPRADLAGHIADRASYWQTIWAYRRVVLTLFLVFPPTFVASYTMLVTFGDYAVTMLGARPVDAYWAALAAQTLYLVMLPLWAYVSDRMGRRFNYTVGYGAIFLLIYPLQTMVLGPGFFQILIPMGIGLFFFAAIASTEVALVSELAPDGVRAQIVSLPSSVSAVVFGGTGPYLRTWLTAYVSPHAFLYYFMGMALLAVLAIRFLVPETKGRELAR